MRKLIVAFSLCLLTAVTCAEDAKDAADHREEGIKALRDSQTNPKSIITAAKHFGRAAAIYEKVGDHDAAVEANSFLYWCKKKMTLADIEAFAKVGEVEVSKQLVKLDEVKVEKTDAQVWFDRAEKFAAANPDEHLLIAVRFFEVADRFIGTDVSVKAQRRSLDEQQLAMKEPAKPQPAQPQPSRPPAEPIAKAAVPDAAKIKEVEKSIRDIFKDEYAKRGAEDKKALGAKLLQQGVETRDDPVSRYVLLKEAAANATAGGDAETVIKSLDVLGQSYEVDTSVLKAEALAKIIPATADAAKALARMYLKVIDEAVAADSYDTAVKLGTAADAAARKAQDMPLVTQVTARGKEVRALQTDFAKVKAAQATLKDKPDDAEANLAVGKFLCFAKRDWEKGLPLLAKGSDAKLKELAEKDLGAKNAAAAGVEAADGWWKLAESHSASVKASLQEHSAEIYRRALPELNGLDKIRVEKRLAQLPSKSKQVMLLNYADVKKNWSAGNWKLQNGALTSEMIQGAKFQLPYSPPAEYDLSLDFTRMDGTDSVCFILVGGGTPFSLGFKSSVHINGLDVKETLKPPAFNWENKRKYSLQIQVRKASLTVILDHKTIAVYKTDFKPIAATWDWKMSSPKQLGLVTWVTPTQFENITVTEISGSGEIIR